MDASGARLLAARIAAGVRIGSRIELLSDFRPDLDTDLRAGDRGTVCGIDSGGIVIVEWERGFHTSMDPRSTEFRSLAA
jgi:hypothetical protein